jgi:hypothetical protein
MIHEHFGRYGSLMMKKLTVSSTLQDDPEAMMKPKKSKRPKKPSVRIAGPEWA